MGNLKADLFLVGSYGAGKERIPLQLKLFDAQNGSELFAAEEGVQVDDTVEDNLKD